jgi:hypothetical protein
MAGQPRRAKLRAVNHATLGGGHAPDSLISAAVDQQYMTNRN